MSIGYRLNKFAVEKYGGKHGYKTLFAKDLGVERETLSKFFNDKLPLSTIMQSKLRELGCDIEWLLTGKRKVWVNGQEIEVIDRNVVEEQAENDELVRKLEAEKAELEDEIRIQQLKIEELLSGFDQLIAENRDLYKKLIMVYERKISNTEQESPKITESPAADLKKIIEVV